MPRGGTIRTIHVEGNERIEEGTILSYMLVQPGDPFSSDRIDRSLRTLYATGLFSDVRMRREGDTLIVHVKENPLVNAILFEGNHNLKSDDLMKELSLRPRAVFTQSMAQADRQKILGMYAAKGRFATTVEPQIIRLPQNRVNVVFHIVEGPESAISRIVFVGNHAFSEARLREEINSRESVWWNFFTSADQYNPERVNFDKELLRRFYLEHGYADFQVVGVTSELSPDRKHFFLTFILDEGPRYRIGKVSVQSDVPKVDAAKYRDMVTVEPGDWYNGRAVDKDATAIQDKLQSSGFPFVQVEPRIVRDRAKHTIDLVYRIEQGPRSYVERIEISGNTRTRDKVIRREFKFAEGDPFNSSAVRKTRQALKDLGYFGDVNINPQPGSAPDKVIVNTDVTEKATGELSIGGGYSTDLGILGQAGIRERNLIGTGIDAGINGTLAARESQVDISATDPYFLDRNLVAGGDVYYLNNNNLYISDYEEKRLGITGRLGYAFNDHLSQAWTYSLVDREVYNVQNTASVFVMDESGWSLLSQVGQTLSLDYRDSRTDPHSGFVVRLGTDFAGLGGDENYVRGKLDGSYYFPLDRFTGNSDWTFVITGGVGNLWNLQSRERIIDRFFLGGDNLRGFEDGGVGPHSVAYTACATPPGFNAQGKCYAPGEYFGSDSLGGNFIWTESTELRFPLPVPADLGLSGRVFADLGGLSGLNVPPNARASCLPTSRMRNGQPIDQYGNVIGDCVYDNGAIRVGAGFGVSWNSPFGLINIDIAAPVVKKSYDQTQVLRFGFGTRF
jgi:outer membrane protein insertion porin family